MYLFFPKKPIHSLLAEHPLLTAEGKEMVIVRVLFA
jgi:hypothetical protein